MAYHGFHPITYPPEHPRSLHDRLTCCAEFMQVVVFVQDLLPFWVPVLEVVETALTDGYITRTY
jgi:hypothetical protein